MKLPQTKALFAYWQKQCRGRAMPDRHDLDPAEMRSVLPYTFMLDIAATSPDHAYPIRLSGTRLDALFGRNLKGHAFMDLCAEGDRSTMSTALAAGIDSAQPIIAGLGGAPSGYAPLRFELLVLPLRHHGRTHERALCSLVPTALSSWMGLKAVEAVALGSWRFIDCALEKTPDDVRPTSRRPHLTLIEGGRSALQSGPNAQSRVKASVA